MQRNCTNSGDRVLGHAVVPCLPLSHVRVARQTKKSLRARAMANGTGQETRGQLKHDQSHDDTSPWRPRKFPCATNRSEEIERHSHGPHLAAMGSSLGGACRETAPALVTASSGMRSPCLPSLTVRVARQTNRYGSELGWAAKTTLFVVTRSGGILVRALLPASLPCDWAFSRLLSRLR